MKDQQTQNKPPEDTLARLLRLAGPRPEASDAVTREVYEGVHEAWLNRTRRGATRRRLLQTALAASVIIGVATMLLPSQTSDPVSGGPLARLDRGTLQIQSAEGWANARAGDSMRDARVRTVSGRAGLILANGISLRLDSDTQIEFQSQEKILLIEGRLYVDTADKTVPDSAVEIATAGGVVRDIGTQFEVDVDSFRTRIRVRDGAVILNTGIDEFAAGRGQALLLTADGRLERAAFASTDTAWNWVMDIAPRFDTDGKPVSELVAWAARESGRELRYADAMTRNAAAAARIRGSVSGRSPEETLSLALETTRFVYRFEDDILSIDKDR